MHFSKLPVRIRLKYFKKRSEKEWRSYGNNKIWWYGMYLEVTGFTFGIFIIDTLDIMGVS